MKAWKLALIIWLPVIVIALVAGGIYLHVHHDNQIKVQQAQAAAAQKSEQNEEAEQAVESCEAKVHATWDPLIQSAQAQGLPTYGDLDTEQSQLNQC
jgi:predicted metalloprotease